MTYRTWTEWRQRVRRKHCKMPRSQSFIQKEEGQDTGHTLFMRPERGERLRIFRIN